MMRRRDFLSAASATLGMVALTQAGCGGGSASSATTAQPSSALSSGSAPIVSAKVDAFTFNDATLFGIHAPTNTLFARDRSGATRWVAGGFGTQAGKLNGPSDLVAAPSGRVYVVDAGNARVQIFDSNGAYIAQFGSYGSGAGQFLSPNCIDVGANGLLYITDAAAHRVQIFGQDGSFKSSFGSFGLDGASLNGPMGLAAIENEVYVVDTGNHRVQVYTLDGAYLRSLGEINALLYPFDVEVATDGTVYVSNPTTFEVVTFGPAGTPTGRLAITHASSPASPQSLSLDAQQQLFISV